MEDEGKLIRIAMRELKTAGGKDFAKQISGMELELQELTWACGGSLTNERSAPEIIRWALAAKACMAHLVNEHFLPHPGDGADVLKPPAHIARVVELIAQFVAKYGLDLEQRVLRKQDPL
eukprot:7011968-Heterocapsa_arctica.AAC.1